MREPAKPAPAKVGGACFGKNMIYQPGLLFSDFVIKIEIRIFNMGNRESPRRFEESPNSRFPLGS